MTQLEVEWLYENLLFDPISNEDVYYINEKIRQYFGYGY